jgi:hypothetical protein
MSIFQLFSKNVLNSLKISVNKNNVWSYKDIPIVATLNNPRVFQFGTVGTLMNEKNYRIIKFKLEKDSTEDCRVKYRFITAGDRVYKLYPKFGFFILTMVGVMYYIYKIDDGLDNKYDNIIRNDNAYYEGYRIGVKNHRDELTRGYEISDQTFIKYGPLLAYIEKKKKLRDDKNKMASELSTIKSMIKDFDNLD